MTEKRTAEKITDLLGSIDELMELARKDTIDEAREGLAAGLVRDSKTPRENLADMLEGFKDSALEGDVDFKSFRAGMRFAASLIADTSYEY